ncbi:Hypothetical protein R9X50_00006600 [Acrodontium crateriforme]|uniref:Uncharacterized protein n=1 Tax=Acrodontium crateriforme TaxID=150365 RepID=A0AAQ3LZP0_9PEZI|nr:Hypothetical protein R9X50_00006600 [Acrodontium crateriforme]
MWLERFSGQTGPQSSSGPSSRGISPVPRRSPQLGSNALSRRPTFSPRSSSLSAPSFVGSNESLPAATRVPNGSNLKGELGTSPAAHVQDPIDVLQSILGPPRSETKGVYDNVDHVMRPTELAGDIDFAGLSLEEFANSKPTKETLANIDIPVIENFEQDKDKFEDLHKSILACDEILKSVEMYLTSFQADLAAVSSEIEHLQDRSTALNNKLNNRQAVEKVLGPEVEAFAVPPALVRKITEGPVDDAWIKALEELERRSKAIDTKFKNGKGIKAAEDVRPLIEDVSTKAVERIRDYVVAQIKALRSPNINAQVIQQNSFLRYKDVFAFLARHQTQLADEISQAYNNTMRWYYSSHFGRYKTALDKLSLYTIDQSDTIAGDLDSKKTTKPGSVHDAFAIGRRAAILRSGNENAIPSFAAEDDKGTHHLEVPFRAFNMALIDNASAECAFLTEFFSKQSFHTTNRQFNAIFSPTFEVGHALTKQLIDSSLDALGVLLCVRMVQHFAFVLQRRKVPTVESYINGANMILWPRFQKIIDGHCESIRKATGSLTGKPAGSALSLTSNAATAQTTAPHQLTQRFANFTHGILTLSSEAGDDEPVSHSLGRLRAEFEAFLLKLSKGIAEARKRDRFLYNNYSLILTIMADAEGKLADELRSHFLDSRDALRVDS